MLTFYCCYPDVQVTSKKGYWIGTKVVLLIKEFHSVSYTTGIFRVYTMVIHVNLILYTQKNSFQPSEIRTCSVFEYPLYMVFFQKSNIQNVFFSLYRPSANLTSLRPPSPRWRASARRCTHSPQTTLKKSKRKIQKFSKRPISQV